MLSKELLEYLLWFAVLGTMIFKGCFVCFAEWLEHVVLDGFGLFCRIAHSIPLAVASPMLRFHEISFVDEFSLSVGNICSERAPWARAHMPPAFPLSSRLAKPGGRNSYWVPGAARPQGPALCLWYPRSLPGLGWASFLSHVMPEMGLPPLLPHRGQVLSMVPKIKK